MAHVFLGIGTNIGDRENNIKRAVRLLKKEGIKIKKASLTIETDAVGGPPQPRFLNTVISIHTNLAPLKLLKKIKRIEKDMGRVSSLRFGPRIIDLDILLYDNLTLNTKELTIPHPRMREREFVLKPLASLISKSYLSRLRKDQQK